MDAASMIFGSAAKVLCLLMLLVAQGQASRQLRGEDEQPLERHSRMLLAANCDNPVITLADGWKPNAWVWKGGFTNKRYAFVDASGKSFKGGTNVYWNLNVMDAGKGKGKTLLVSVGWTQGMFYPGGVFSWRLYKGDVTTPANKLCKNSKSLPDGAIAGGDMDTTQFNMMALNYHTTKAGMTDQPFSNIVSCTSGPPAPFMLVTTLVYTNGHGSYFGRYGTNMSNKQICNGGGQYFNAVVFNVKCACGNLEKGR